MLRLLDKGAMQKGSKKDETEKENVRHFPK